LFGALRMMAADPFTGTWKIDLSQAKFSQKPIKIELANGTYKCLSCDPPITVKADGTDQPVSGQPGFDTFSVHVVDDHHLEAVAKKALSTDTTYTASPAVSVGFSFTAGRLGRGADGRFRVKKITHFSRTLPEPLRRCWSEILLVEGRDLLANGCGLARDQAFCDLHAHIR
jgi:hypothetical protein